MHLFPWIGPRCDAPLQAGALLHYQLTADATPAEWGFETQVSAMDLISLCFHHPYRIGAAAAAAACCGPIDCMLVLGFLLRCLLAAPAACHFRCVSPGLCLNEARRMHESVCAHSYALGNGTSLETKKRTTNFPIMFRTLTGMSLTIRSAP